ncbi:MAG: hypothetical protein H6843_14115 [Rhodospirillaceae bacterium]|nr:hypothetical protein [Rhodospirillaceae bacterium]
MSGKSKKQAAPSGGAAAGDAASGSAGAAAGDAPGDLPFGWYYYGPDPAMEAAAAGGPGGHGGPAHGDDTAAYRAAFDQLARGDLNADTLGKLFNLDDRDFWKGALVGAAATLVLSNLPAIKSMLAGLAASAGTPAGHASDDGPGEDDVPA